MRMSEGDNAGGDAASFRRLVGYELREARNGDIPGIEAVYFRSWRAAYEDFLEPDVLNDQARRRRSFDWSRRMKDPTAAVLVASTASEATARPSKVSDTTCKFYRTHVRYTVCWRHWRRAIEELDLPLGGAALAEVLALSDRLEAKVSEAVGAFDAADGFAADGALTCASWLRHFARRSAREASRCVAVARRVRVLPCTRAAWSDGTLSSGQVQAVVANVSDATVEHFVAREESLVPVLSPLSVDQTAVAMRHWRLQAEALLDPPEPSEATRSLHCSRIMDGRRELKGHLDAEGGELLEAALRQAASPDVEGEAPRAASQRRAEALVDMCRGFLDHQGDASVVRRHRPHVNVVVDLEELEQQGVGRVVNGPYLDAATISRILCDAGVHRAVTAGPSSILDFGRTTRTIPAALWRHWCFETGIAAFPAVIARRNGARRTTSSTGPRAVRPACGTRCSAAPDIIICSTNGVGRSSCCPTAMWR